MKVLEADPFRQQGPARPAFTPKALLVVQIALFHLSLGLALKYPPPLLLSMLHFNLRLINWNLNELLLPTAPQRQMQRQMSMPLPQALTMLSRPLLKYPVGGDPLSLCPRPRPFFLVLHQLCLSHPHRHVHPGLQRYANIISRYCLLSHLL